MGLYGPDVPASPDYARANREGVSANLEALGPQKQVEAAARLGTKVTYTDPFDNQEKTLDFTGFGDLDQARDMLPFIAESADAVAKAQLETSQKYGVDFIEQRLKELKASDPVGFQAREEMGDRVLNELRLGSKLDDEQQREVTQAERAAQAARGNIWGSGNAAAEAMSVGDAGFRIKQQRLANAAAFLQGSTPVAQFGQISGAQAGASPFTPLNVQRGLGVDPNAGYQAANFDLRNYTNELKWWDLKRSTSTGQRILDGINGAVAGYAGGGGGGGGGGVGVAGPWGAVIGGVSQGMGHKTPTWL